MATTLLTVTGNPSSYPAGTWPDAAMNGGLWRFTFTTAGSSASGTYSPFCAFFCGPVVGGTSGGLWIEQNALELYDTDDNLVFTQPMTFDSGQTLTIEIDVPNTTVTIAGATTGNGAFGFADTGPYFFAGTTLTAGGVTGQGGFEISGTIGDIDDAGTGETIACDSGSFVLTGTDAEVRATSLVAAGSGSFALTGTDALLMAGATIACEPGAFTLAGSDAGVLARSVVAATPGAFAITGGAATLRADAALVAAAGSFAIAGSDASLAAGTRVGGTAGAFSLTGSDAALRANAVIGAISGAFVLTGTGASIVSSTDDAFSAVEDAIYRWVVVGSGLAPGQVIWGTVGGGGPQPTGLYISMLLLGIDSVSDDWIISRKEGGVIVRHVRGTRHPTLELRCFAGSSYGVLRAELVLSRVLAAALLPSVAKILRAGDVGVGTFGKVRVAPGSRSTMFDPLALVEVELHITIDVAEVGNSIDSVETDLTPPGVTLTATRPA